MKNFEIYILKYLKLHVIILSQAFETQGNICLQSYKYDAFNLIDFNVYLRWYSVYKKFRYHMWKNC